MKPIFETERGELFTANELKRLFNDYIDGYPPIYALDVFGLKYYQSEILEKFFPEVYSEEFGEWLGEIGAHKLG